MTHADLLKLRRARIAGDPDRRILRDFEQTLPELPMTDEVWAAMSCCHRGPP